MAKQAVVTGAILKCSSGAAPSPLNATTAPGVQINNQPIATIKDNLSGVNVMPFGLCAITGNACVPVTPMPWQPGEVHILLSSPFPILSSECTLMCSVGGLIQIVVPGQVSISFGSSSAGDRHFERKNRLDSDEVDSKDQEIDKPLLGFLPDSPSAFEPLVSHQELPSCPRSQQQGPRASALTEDEAAAANAKEEFHRNWFPEMAESYYGPEESEDELDSQVHRAKLEVNNAQKVIETIIKEGAEGTQDRLQQARDARDRAKASLEEAEARRRGPNDRRARHQRKARSGGGKG